jgi:tRNA-specific 2-thiouridylase
MRVLLGMSGGVDSSVAALRLIKAGVSVTGVTMILSEPLKSDGKSVSGDVEDARRVCSDLGIEHFTADFKEEFRKTVVDDFIGEYCRGLTPSPCIVCNEKIKFGLMLKLALEKGFDCVATGHYAGISKDPSGRYLLKKSKSSKDQSYFLYRLSQYQLAHSMFPVGDSEKEEIRSEAEKAGLVVSHKGDSQEICFIRGCRYDTFIDSLAEKVPGSGLFTDKEGKPLGEHEGIHRYTIGQRKGLGIALGEPAYVTDIDSVNNTVILGKSEDLMSSGMTVKDINYIPFDELRGRMNVSVKIRNQARPAEAELIPGQGGTARVMFSQKQRAVTPGQSAVFYSGDTVVGGGRIMNRIR